MSGDKVTPCRVTHQVRMQRVHVVQPHEKNHEGARDKLWASRRIGSAGWRL